MLNSISIKNFRVAECTIEGLGRINVFIGKNNSGKSSALEAICIAKSALSNKAFGEPLLKSLLSRRGADRSLYTVRDFWHNYETGEDISLVLGFEEEENTVEILVRWESDNSLIVKVSAIGPEVEGPSGAGFREVYGAFEVRVNLGTNVPQALDGQPDAVLSGSSMGYLRDLTLVDDQIARKLEEHETSIFGKVLENRLDKKIAQELRASYGVPAESLSYIPFSPSISGKTKLAVVTPELAIHIDEMGDGAKYATIILAIALLLENTALLIEEIESHQHSGAIKKILPSLIDVVTKNKVQLLLTTHNLEVIQTLSHLTGKYDIRFFHFEKFQDGKVEVRSIGKADSKLLSDLGVDLRYLHKKFLVVEGKSDVVFFDAIIRRILGKNVGALGYFTVPAGNKGLAKQLAAALASTGREVVVAVDLDDQNVSSLVQGIRRTLCGKGLKVKSPLKNKIFTILDTGSVVKLIGLGISKDSSLDRIGITQHEMEDYLLKLIELDKNVANWFGLSLSQLMMDAKKAKLQRLDKSETLLCCAAMKKGVKYEEFIKKIVEIADKGTLRKIVANVLVAFSS